MVRAAAPQHVEVVIDDQPMAVARPPARRVLGGVAAVALVLGFAVLRPTPEPDVPDREPVVAPAVTGAPLAPSLEDLWMVRWQVAGDVLAVGSAVLVTGADGSGVSALDDGGARLWGPVAEGYDCAPSGQGAVCLPPPGAGARALVVSAAGEVTARFEPSIDPFAWWVLDGDVVTLGKDGGHLVAQRWVPPGRSGPSWTFRSADPVLAPTSYPFSVEQTATWAMVGGTRSVTLDLARGREVAGPEAVRAPTSRTPSTWVRDDSAPGLAVLSDGDDVVVSGVGWFPAPAHLLLDGVLLAGSPALTAYALPGGEPLWTSTGTAAFSDGVSAALVEQVAGGASVVVRDLRTGTERWRLDAPGACARLVGVTDAGAVLAGCGTVALLGPADA